MIVCILDATDLELGRVNIAGSMWVARANHFENMGLVQVHIDVSGRPEKFELNWTGSKGTVEVDNPFVYAGQILEFPPGALVLNLPGENYVPSRSLLSRRSRILDRICQSFMG